MKKIYVYMFLLIYVFINSVIRQININIIYGMDINLSSNDLVIYIPFIIVFIFYINGMYSSLLKTYGYLKIIRYKSRKKWINFITKKLAFESFEYTIILNIIILIFNSIDMSFVDYLKGFFLLFMGIYILSLLLVLIEYIWGSLVSLLVIVGYLSFTIPYVHYTLSNGRNIGILKFFLIPTYLEASIRDMFMVKYYVYVIFSFLIILVLYLITIKIFNKKEIM